MRFTSSRTAFAFAVVAVFMHGTSGQGGTPGGGAGVVPDSSGVLEPPQEPPASPQRSRVQNLGAQASEGPYDGKEAWECRVGPTRPTPCIDGDSGAFNPSDLSQRCEVDATIAGRGLDFVFARTYRSRSQGSGPLGHGWDHSYDVFIERVGDAIRLHDGSGRADLFRLQSDGAYGADGFFLEGRFASDGSFKFTFPDGGAWEFHPLNGAPARGKLRTSRDRNGNHLDFDYDGRGRLVRVHDTLDSLTSPRTIDFTYDADDRITTLHDFTGRVWRYEYHSSGPGGGSTGDLKSVTGPPVVGTPHGNDFPNGKTTSYAYSKGFADERLNHNLLSITDSKGETQVRFVYSATLDPQAFDFDRVTGILRRNPDDIGCVYVPSPPGATKQGPTTRMIANDFVGNVREYFYDAQNRLVLERDYTGRADPNQPTTPSSNRPTGQLRASDPQYFESSFSYQADSLLTQVVRPNGDVVRLSWEGEVNPAARRRTRGNLRSVTRLPGPLGGDQAALLQQFDYNTAAGATHGLNFVTRAVDPRGNVTLHSYDAAGNRIQTVRRLPSIVDDWSYDAAGQLTLHRWPGDGGGHRRKDVFRYYPATAGVQRGYLKEVVLDAGGFALTTMFEHDALGRVTRTVDPKGNDASTTWNALDQVVRTLSREVKPGTGVRYEQLLAYDENDNLVRVDVENRDDQGVLQSNTHYTTQYEYDALDRLVRTTREVEDGVAPPVVTEYRYEDNDHLRLVRFGEATNGHQPANTLTLRYDERDLLFRVIRAAGDPDESVTRRDYDGNGNLIAQKVMSSSGPLRTATCAYDGFDRLVATTDAMGNVQSLHYDENGKVRSSTQYGELVDLPGSANNLRLAHVTFDYDAMDRLVVRTRDWFDPATQASIGDGSSLTHWTWNDAGFVEVCTDDNGHTYVVEHDTALRRHAIVDPRGNRRELGYDPNSNVVSLLETDLSDVSATPELIPSQYEYDGLDRRIRSIDGLGNSDEAFLDSRDHLVRRRDPLGNVEIYAYDGLSRLVRSEQLLTDTGTGSGTVVGSIVRAWSWDDDSRLVSATDPNGNGTRYVWDALDRRIRKDFADGTQSHATYDVFDDLIQTVDANGTSVARICDGRSRCTHNTVTPGPGVSSQTTFEQWSYDGLSRIIDGRDDDSIVTRAFDSLDNLTRETQNGAPLSMTHDGMGSVTSCIYPGGRTLQRTFDPLDRVRLVADTNGTTLFDALYVGDDRPAQCDLANGTRTTWTFDGLRRVSDVRHVRDPNGANVLLGERALTWDARSSPTSDSDLVAAVTRLWSYDSADRLIRSDESSSPGGATIDYTLDGADNRTSVNGGPAPGPYGMDPTLPVPGDFQRNQYTTTPLDSRNYDNDGNLVAMGGPTGALLLSYDWADQLVLQQDLATNESAIHRYDVFGREIAKQLVSGGQPVTTNYYYDGGDVVEERDGGGGTTATYVSVDPGTASSPGRHALQPRLMQRGGSESWLHGDAFGSTRLASDATGVLVEQTGYDDFGLPHFSDQSGVALASSAIHNPYLFEGMRLESYDGSDRFYSDGGARYDASVGRRSSTGGGRTQGVLGQKAKAWMVNNFAAAGGGHVQGVLGQKAKAWMAGNYEVHPVFGLKTEWITSMDLPKITPKVAKESHGKFRLPLLNYASIDFASIKIEIGAASHKSLEDLAVRILQDSQREDREYITSIDLPKITPKVAKESHGKFRLPLLNYASIDFASIKIEIGAASHKSLEDLAVRILQDGNCEESEFQDCFIDMKDQSLKTVLGTDTLIDMKDPSLKTVLGTFTLVGCGLRKWDWPPKLEGGKEGLATGTIEFMVEDFRYTIKHK